MKTKLIDFILLNFGLVLITIAIHFFLAPNHIVIGGASGLSILVHQYVPEVSLGVILLFFEFILFGVGIVFLGFQFGIKSFYASIMLSVYVWLFETLLPVKAPLSDDILIQLLFFLLLDAAGLLLIFKQNASSGGTDIVAMILNKYFGVSIGTGVLMADFLIATGSFGVFGFENGMYAVFGILLLSLYINVLSSQTNLSKQVMIISSQSNDIKSYIVKDLNKGATIHSATGAFTNENRDIITTFLGRKEFMKLKKHILTIDEKAFVTVQNTSEIIGNGFRRSL